MAQSVSVNLISTLTFDDYEVVVDPLTGEKEKFWYPHTLEVGRDIAPERVKVMNLAIKDEHGHELLECRTHMAGSAVCANGHCHGFLYKCGLRYCPICSKYKAINKSMELRNRFGLTNKPVRLITLTKKKSGDVKRDFIETRKALRKWLKHVNKYKPNWLRSGFYAFELGPSGNVHIHIIQVDGSFVPQKKLSELWLKVTGDSYVVDVRRVRGKYGANYVAKYASKGMSEKTFEKLPSEVLESYFIGLKKKKFYGYLGKMYGSVKKDRVCPYCGAKFTEIYFGYSITDLNQKLGHFCPYCDIERNKGVQSVLKPG